jgi:hypothetical protein
MRVFSLASSSSFWVKAISPEKPRCLRVSRREAPPLSVSSNTLLSEGILATWALWLGLLSAWFAYKWAIDAARTYGALIEASFDIYRHLLYESIRWHLPPDPEEERHTGRKLTQYSKFISNEVPLESCKPFWVMIA